MYILNSSYDLNREIVHVYQSMCKHMIESQIIMHAGTTYRTISLWTLYIGGDYRSVVSLSVLPNKLYAFSKLNWLYLAFVIRVADNTFKKDYTTSHRSVFAWISMLVMVCWYKSVVTIPLPMTINEPYRDSYSGVPVATNYILVLKSREIKCMYAVIWYSKDMWYIALRSIT